MAADTVDVVTKSLGRGGRSQTKRLKLHGATKANDALAKRFGTDAAAVAALIASDASLGEPLVEGLPYVRAEAVWSARHEMVHTLADVLARRTRALLLDRDATVAAAPSVAALVAPELGWSSAEVAAQVEAFLEVAKV